MNVRLDYGTTAALRLRRVSAGRGPQARCDQSFRVFKETDPVGTACTARTMRWGGSLIDAY